jgi:diguanylate cyclase (GGDEF)-like protein/PAS domain S-box-containing protein
VRLRARMLLLVGVTMAVLLALVLLGTTALFLPRFDVLETRAAAVDALRLRAALDTEIGQLERVARDIAPRDSAYDFMKGARPDPPSNLRTVESLVGLGANLVVMVGTDDGVRLAESIELDVQTSAPKDEPGLAAILAARVLRNEKDPRGHTSGLLRVGDKIMLVAARSITENDMYAAPAGTLVIGRYLDSTEVGRLGTMTQLTVSAHVLGGRRVPADVLRAADVLAQGVTEWSAPLDDDTLGAYTAFDDVTGVPALVLRADLPRDIHGQGLAAVVSLAVATILVGAVATLTVLLVVDRAVLSRILRLSSQLAEITEQRDITARVAAKGDDELGSLAAGVNEMLSAIEDSEREIVRARDELEQRVHERTAELRASESRYRTLVERMADAVFSVDPAGIVSFANPQAADLTGRTVHRLVGAAFRELMTSASAEQMDRSLAARRSPDAAVTVEGSFIHETEGPTPVELGLTPMLGDDGEPAGLQCIAHDIAQRKRYEAELLHLASHDHLTGLYNRRHFEEALERELSRARRSEGHGAVLWLDLDDFKDVNDTLGHRAGDEVLQELAAHLPQQVRDYSVLARLGGDEFGVLLPNVGPDQAASIADRVLTAVNARTYSVGGHAIRVSASMGVVLFPIHGSTVDELMARADVSMYAAKDAGRAVLHIHRGEEGSPAEHRARIQWNERIVEALREDRFVLHAQPILDLRTGTITRHELLIRMLDDEGGTVLPGEFLPTAERLGLIRDIDRWVVRRAVELLAEHRDEAVTLDINLSGKVFSDTGILAAVATALKEADIEPSRLGFEITETAAVADILRAQEFICTLSDIGCRFSLDDFGSGFSSFYYLRHLPIDCLKVDGSFIRGLPHSEQDRHLVRGMVELCRGLEVEIAAEFVEGAETLKVVRDLGLDYAQGSAVGQPIPVDEALSSQGRPES